MPSFSLVLNEPMLDDRFGTIVRAGAMWRRIGAAMRREPFPIAGAYPEHYRAVALPCLSGNSAAATSVSSRRWLIAAQQGIDALLMRAGLSVSGAPCSAGESRSASCRRRGDRADVRNWCSNDQPSPRSGRRRRWLVHVRTELRPAVHAVVRRADLENVTCVARRRVGLDLGRVAPLPRPEDRIERLVEPAGTGSCWRASPALSRVTLGP